MADKKQLKEAKSTFTALCKALDKRNWKYQADEEKMMLKYDVSGDDLKMSFVIGVDADRKLVRLVSWLPFTVEKNPGAVARAIVQANYQMIAGAFEYDATDGSVCFQLSASYTGAILGDGAFNYMVNVAANSVDEYNDEFLMLEQGHITIDQFLKKHA